MSELRLNTDGHIIKLGADNDVTLTHVADTGILLNSTMQLQFNDSSQFINAPSATVLDINATDEIELNATAVDLNGTLDVSGTLTQTGVATFSARSVHSSGITIADAGQIGSASDADAIAIASNGVVTFSQNPVFPDGGVAVADLDIDGATDIGAAIVDADLFIVDDGAGGTNRKTVASRLKTYIGNNTPAFSAYTDANDNFSDATWVKAEHDAETYDSGGYAVASDKFTPAEAGTYLFFMSDILTANADGQLDAAGVRLYKNGATIAQTFWDFGDSPGNQGGFSFHAVDTADADDYYEIYIYADDTSGNPTIHGGTAPIDSVFSAIKIAGS